jgi:hypothetical protein
MKKLTSLFFTALFSATLCVALSAQSAPPQPKPTPPLATAPAPTAPPLLTELETAKFENFRLRSIILSEQENELRSQYAALVSDVQKEHPGYAYDPQRGQLVKIAEPKADKK